MTYKEMVFPNNCSFLVTGGAGFIGSNLCESILNLGYNVKCLDNFSTGKRENIEEFIDHPAFLMIEGDIRNLDTCMDVCQGVDYVLHQAAWGSVPRSIEMPLLYEEINIKGTLNMMQAAKENQVKRFIFASSSSVYGDSEIMPKKEGKEGKVLSPYALTKKVNEEFGALYWKLYGLETIGLRYFNVFGRKQDPNGFYAAAIPKFIRLLLNGESPVIYGDGRQSRDFTYIENVIEANLRACATSTEAVGQVYNIAYGSREYLLDICNILNSLLGIDIDPVFAPERPGDIKHSHADISKAHRLLKYQPQYDFSTGIALAIEWYVQQYNNGLL